MDIDDVARQLRELYEVTLNHTEPFSAYGEAAKEESRLRVEETLIFTRLMLQALRAESPGA